ADEMQLEELIKHDNGNMDYVELILFHRIFGFYILMLTLFRGTIRQFSSRRYGHS
ncbi:10988_t:CDS:1, partial [Paraglomus brasilianum]